MTDASIGQRKIKQYLQELAAALRSLPAEQVRDIVEELRSHIVEKMSGNLAPDSVDRGYLMNRAADLGRGSRFAWIFSLLLVSAVFGSSHSDQGLTGQIIEGIAGFFLGLMYLRTGKNLAVPIVAHGACDTLDMVLLFLGKYPGT